MPTRGESNDGSRPAMPKQAGSLWLTTTTKPSAYFRFRCPPGAALYRYKNDEGELVRVPVTLKDSHLSVLGLLIERRADEVCGKVSGTKAFVTKYQLLESMGSRARSHDVAYKQIEELRSRMGERSIIERRLNVGYRLTAQVHTARPADLSGDREVDDRPQTALRRYIHDHPHLAGATLDEIVSVSEMLQELPAVWSRVDGSLLAALADALMARVAPEGRLILVERAQGKTLEQIAHERGRPVAWVKDVLANVAVALMQASQTQRAPQKAR